MKRNLKLPFTSNADVKWFIFAAIGLSFFLLPFAAYWNSQAAGTYSGRVFQDYNGNGTYNTAGDVTNPAVDRGIAGVTVTLYDSAGAAQGAANTIADGTFSIASTGTGPYRVEFTNIPAGYQPSARSTDSVNGGSTATDAGSTVQFVANAGDTNINLALNVPDDYCQNNPLVCNAMYLVGNVDGAALHTFPYNYSSELDGNLGGTWTAAPSRTATLAPSSIGTNANLGATFGLAWDKNNNRLFASAYVKRGARQGSLSSESTGAIFVKNTPSSASPAPTVYVDLNTVFGANTTGANPHPVATTDWTSAESDPGTTQFVSKRGLGDLEISQDGANLYTVNLADRRLYVIPTSGTLNSTTITRFDVPTTGLATSSGNCNAADVRPFGLGRNSSGQIFVGAVCSAESEAADTKLHLYVWRFDNPGFTLVLNRSLSNFTRYIGSTQTTESWERWSNTVSELSKPSPMLGDIDFDGNAMILGIRDRYGDQVVFPDFYRGYGDIMRACLVSGTYTFEANATCGGTTTGGIALQYADTFAAIAYNGSTGTNAWTSAWTEINESDGVNAGSVRVLASTETATNAVRITDSATNFGIRRSFSLTGLSTPPILTFDYYRDGVGATLQYFDGSTWQTLNTFGNGTDAAAVTYSVALPINATEIRFTVPSVGGTNYFYFDNLSILTTSGSNGEYYLDLNGDGREEGLLGSLLQVPGHTSAMTTAYDAVVYNSSGTRVSNFYTAGVQKYNNTTGVMSGAYDAYLDADPNNFGKANGIGDIEALCDRAPIELGNRVWRDTDNNGVQDAGENGIAGVTVRLYNTSNTLIATAVTDANGEYYFTSGTAADGNITDNIGIVNGQILTNTNYQIRADLAANYTGGNPLNGLLMTTRDQTSQLGFDDGSDSDSSLVTNPTGSPSGTYPVISITTGSAGNNDHNYDIGFASTTTYSVGNRVWFDTNNDGQINAGEVGISGVSVSLFLDANADGTPDTPGTAVGTMNTDANGYYRFDSLAANTYVVRVNATNFANAAVLGGYANTTGSNNTDTDSTSVAGQNGENGINPSGAANTVQTNGILSGSITLGAPGEPVSEADVQGSGQGSVDPAANMTVDFGFYRACISGVVWNDNGAGTPANNNNGILNAGESMIPSVRVRLFDSANTEVSVGPDGILGTSDDATNGMLTNSGGNYSFCGLPPAQFRVVVTTPGGSSSTPTETDPNLNIDNNDNGFPGTAPFVGFTTSGLVTVLPGSTGTAGNKVVTNSTGTTSDPTIDFGFVLPPTAVTLDKFTVTTDGGAVALNWSTGGESGNLGFNIYRETNGVRELVTPAPIAGSALKTTANLVANGDNYSWVDKEARLGSIYYLEDLDVDGNRTMYGPVTPMFKVSMSKFERNAVLVSDLANLPNAATQKEFVTERYENNNLNSSRQFEIAAMSGLKISVNHDGWYKVSAEQLTANGFDVNSNRANWQLFVGGEEVAIRVATDGSVEFFGRGADTLETDRNVYYLVNGQTGGMRLTEVKGGRAGQNPLAAYVSTVERKDRAIYVSSFLNGESENWFGAIISNSAQTIQTLTLNNIQPNSSARLRVKLQGLTNSAHFVNVRINDTDLGQVNFDSIENSAFEFDVPASALVEGANSVKLQAAGASSDVSLVDTVSLSYSRLFKAVNNQIRFSLPAGQSVRVGGFTNGRIAINEIQNGSVGVRAESLIHETDGEFSFELAAAGRNREFLAVSILQSEQPVSIERNAPSTLNSASNRADFVIIAPAIFQDQAEHLARMRQAQGLKSQVVLTEDIADEYGYGTLTAESVKQFLRNATINWSVKPRYAVLFGDSSYDQRNYLGQLNRNLIPTKLVDTVFMETSGDSWLADFNNDNVEDIALGRLPAANTEEADVLIEKLARYDQQPARTQKTVVLPSDRTFESYIQTLQSEVPNNINTIRIDRSAMSDAEMHNQIMSALNDNPMITAYLGHGSTGVWAASSVFNVNDASSLNNSLLGFFMLTTCLNGYTHNAYNDSLAEVALKNPNGGAIVVWASSGTNFADMQTPVSRAAMQMIFNPQNGPVRIGDIVRLSKQATGDADVRRNYMLLGDPTVFIK